MFADAAKTTAITDGTGIYTWSPKSGSVSTDAIQAASANRPTYRANYAATGFPAVEFDGSNDNFAIAHSTGWNISDVFEFFAVIRATATGGYRPILLKQSTGSWNNGFGVTQYLGFWGIGSPQYSMIHMPETLNAWVLLYGRVGNASPIVGRVTRADSSEFVPVIATGSTTTPGTNTADVQIGWGPSGDYWKGGIGELRVYGGGESKATLDSVLYDMATRWGIMASQSGGTSRPSSPFLSQVIG